MKLATIHNFRHPVGRLVCRIASVVLTGYMAIPWLAADPLLAAEAMREGSLQINEGKYVQGSLVDCDQLQRIRWNVTGFDRPFDFDIGRIDGVRFTSTRDPRTPQGNMGCELLNGDLLYGDLEELKEDTLQLATSHGKVTVQRSAVRRLIPQHASANLIYLGPNGLNGWIASDNAWRDESGRPVAIREQGVLFGNLHVPEQACIELELTWDREPDFAVTLGVGAIAVYARKAFRIETWGNEVVLVREVEDRADVVLLRKLDREQRRLSLIVYLDQTKGQAIAVSETREMLGELNVPGSAGSGIRIEARKPGVKLERLQISRWNGLTPHPHETDRPRVHRTDGSVVAGTLVGFDANTKELQVQAETEIMRLPWDEVDAVVLSGGNAVSAPPGLLRVATASGMRFSGELVETTQAGLHVRSPFVEPLVVLPLDQVVALSCGTGQKADPNGTDGDIGSLEFDQQVIPGKVVGVETASGKSQLLWQPIGSVTASPIADGVAGKIVYRESQPIAETAEPRQTVIGGILRAMTRSRKPLSPSSHAIHLRMGDSFPCEVKGINEQGVTFETAVSDAKFVKNDDIQAVVLAVGKPQAVPPRAKRQRLLTLPRMQRDSPPTHLIQSREGDFLRARVTGMDENVVTTEIHLETKAIPREHVAFITWLHEGESVDQVAAQPGLVQAVRGDGVRITMIPTSFTGTTMAGTSPVLGAVNVDLQRVDQLLIGRLIEREASRLSFHRWKLRPAIEPRYLSQTSSPDGANGGQESSLVGKPAPNIELDTLDGQKFNLASHQGKIVVLDFWATWCGPCIQWMPEAEKIAAEFADKEVEFITVNLEEDAATIRKLLERLSLDPPVLLDRDGVAAHAYEARSIPQTVVIDRTGNVARLFIGGGSAIAGQLRSALEALTKAP